MFFCFWLQSLMSAVKNVLAILFSVFSAACPHAIAIHSNLSEISIWRILQWWIAYTVLSRRLREINKHRNVNSEHRWSHNMRVLIRYVCCVFLNNAAWFMGEVTDPHEMLCFLAESRIRINCWENAMLHSVVTILKVKSFLAFWIVSYGLNKWYTCTWH